MQMPAAEQRAPETTGTRIYQTLCMNSSMYLIMKGVKAIARFVERFTRGLELTYGRISHERHVNDRTLTIYLENHEWLKR
jgi:hypothetical protein